MPGSGVSTVKPRDLDGSYGVGERRVLAQAREALVGRRFEAEEEVELVGERTPLCEVLGMARDQIRSRLHEHPTLLHAAARERARQLEAALAGMKEEVVDYEDVAADAEKIATDGVDRAQCGASAPTHRAEAAAIWATTSSFE